MSSEDPLFSTLSPKRRRIAVAYELIRFEPDSSGDTVVRRLAKRLGYKINRNGSCTFVAETIQMYKEKKSNPALS